MTRTAATLIAAAAALLAPGTGKAGADLECGMEASSQVEIGKCLAETEARVDRTVTAAFELAMTSARDLEEVTGRPIAVLVLEASQDAWTAYRNSHCDYVGATFGGGSGTGIAIRSCRIELGRARADELLRHAR